MTNPGGWTVRVMSCVAAMVIGAVVASIHATSSANPVGTWRLGGGQLDIYPDGAWAWQDEFAIGRWVADGRRVTLYLGDHHATYELRGSQLVSVEQGLTPMTWTRTSRTPEGEPPARERVTPRLTARAGA